MNILIVSRGYPSKQHVGNGIFEYDQAKALAAAGHRVVMACTDIRSIRRWRKWGYEHLTRDGVEIYVMNIPVGAVPYAIQQAFIWIALQRLYPRIEKKQGRPDILHAHFYFEAGAAGSLSHRTHIPLVVTEHSSEVNQEPLPDKIRRRLLWAYRHVDRLIAVSEPLAARIKASTGIDAVCIPNMLNLDAFRYKPAESKMQMGFCFVTVGNLLPVKGHDVLIAAFARAVRAHPEIRLDIIGSGQCGAELKRQVNRLGLTNTVRFHGLLPRNEVAERLSQADAFVLASRSETFGLAYIEAMASGLPVIATRCGGPEGFVMPENGLLVPAEDADALAEAMEHMIAHAAEYDRERISAYARARFSPPRIAAELEKVYADVLAQNAERRTRP